MVEVFFPIFFVNDNENFTYKLEENLKMSSFVKIESIYYHAQLSHPEKCCSLIELVVCIGALVILDDILK